MPNVKVLAAGAAACGAAAGLVTGGVTLALGHRFISEFTRPGVTIDPHSPLWGGWTFPEAIAEPPRELQRSVTFVSADGAALRGEFWAQPHAASTIIISHGFHLPCAHFRSVAALEYSHGVNLFLFDYRGHGESAQIPTTCGNAEVNDLIAAVQVAAGQPETRPNSVYIHGFSMGAAVALLMPQQPAVAGIIADSPYARLDEMILLIIAQLFDQETAQLQGPARVVRRLIPLLTHLTFTSGRILFQARYHHRLIARPEHAIQRHVRAQARQSFSMAPAPILLIHAERDPLIAVRHARRLAAAARVVGRPIQEYYTPSPIHCGSYGHDPQRYMALLQRFLAA
jgi:alpha-beta hydrolase superfamily lysophospholipase